MHAAAVAYRLVNPPLEVEVEVEVVEGAVAVDDILNKRKIKNDGNRNISLLRENTRNKKNEDDERKKRKNAVC